MDENAELMKNQGIAGMGVQNIGLPGKMNPKNSEVTILEEPAAHSIGALLFIEQYVSLRNEIEKRIEIRQQILALTLIISGTFLTIGVQPNISGIVLLFYPIIALFLAALWSHNDLRVGQISWYIQRELEKHLGALGPGWETYRRQTFLPRQRQKMRQSKLIEQEHHLSPPTGLLKFATNGVFLTTQILSIAISAVRFFFEVMQNKYVVNLQDPKQLGMTIPVVILFIADIGVLLITNNMLQHRRG